MLLVAGSVNFETANNVNGNIVRDCARARAISLAKRKARQRAHVRPEARFHFYEPVKVGLIATHSYGRGYNQEILALRFV